MKRLAVLVVSALVAASCGGSDAARDALQPPQSDAPTSTEARIDPATSPPTSVAPSTTVEAAFVGGGLACDPALAEFVDAQFAFVGTVIDVRGEILPWDVDVENSDRPDQPEPTRWVTFNVEGWYTVDWGTQFSVWMPVHQAVVGDRLAVGGDARFVSIDSFSGQSGEVEFCTPAPDPLDESLTAWDAFFGPPIEAGAAVAEGEPDPADLDAIDQAEVAWNTVSGDSYSYLLSLYDRNSRPPQCASSTQRIVVIDGETTEATSISAPPFACERSLEEVPSIAELFDLARQVAGATDFDFRSNLDNGTVMNFYASDRSIETQVHVHRWTESTAPTVVGWDSVSQAAQEAADGWVSAPRDRTTRVQIGGGERAHYDLTTTEVDGEVVEVRNGADVIDPSTLNQPWTPFTVEGVFDLIEELSGQGHVVAVFDTQTGAPTDLFFDPMPDSIDDEMSLRIAITWPPTADTSPPRESEAEQALRQGGADLAQFPGDLDDLVQAQFCGAQTVTFDSDQTDIAPAIRCLSDHVQDGSSASAVFTTFTDEGDPIVSLWFVETDRVSVFVDSSQDAYAGGPFAWRKFVCDIALPLPQPKNAYPDPSSTFDC